MLVLKKEITNGGLVGIHVTIRGGGGPTITGTTTLTGDTVTGIVVNTQGKIHNCTKYYSYRQ